MQGRNNNDNDYHNYCDIVYNIIYPVSKHSGFIYYEYMKACSNCKDLTTILT